MIPYTCRLHAISSLALLVLTSILAGCGNLSNNPLAGFQQPNPPTPPRIAAVDSNNHLLVFNANAPSTILSTITIQNVAAPNEFFAGIAFNTSNNQLVGLTNVGRILQIDGSTGATTQLGVANIGGVVTGMSLIPGSNQMRVVTTTNQNIRINLNGTIAGTDTALEYVGGDPNQGVVPHVAGLAYVAGAVPVAFLVDVNTNDLIRLGNINGNPTPSNGALYTVADSGAKLTSPVGLAIDLAAGSIYGSFQPQGSQGTEFDQFDAVSGHALAVGQIASQASITAIAVL